MGVVFRERKREKESLIEKVEVDEIYEFAKFVRDPEQAQRVAALLMFWREYKMFQCLTGFESACREVEHDVDRANKLPPSFVKKNEEYIINSLNRVLERV